jgi:peptidoglycan/xylan/chitin deacetylase (PgdA/CDA1 family)
MPATQAADAATLPYTAAPLQYAAAPLPYERRSAGLSEVLVDKEPETVELAQRVPRVLLSGNTEERVVALTFDLDMSPQMVWMLRSDEARSWINEDAFSYLKETGVHATLFITGMWAEVYPNQAHELAASGQFEIANHTYSHPAFHTPCYRLGGLGPGGAAAELSQSQEAIKRATGVTPTYFRFPGGCYDSRALDAVHAAGLIPVQWNVNSIDAFNPNADQIAYTVVSQARPGSIVVMHLHGGPNAPASGAALRQIIPALQAQGYRFVTVSELLQVAIPVEPNDPSEVVEFRVPPPCYPSRYHRC